MLLIKIRDPLVPVLRILTTSGSGSRRTGGMHVCLLSWLTGALILG